MSTFVIEAESLPSPSLTSLPNPGMVFVASQMNVPCAFSNAVDGSSDLNHELKYCHDSSSESSSSSSMNGVMQAPFSLIRGMELVVIA
ncbi:trans-resveratrol di-O-methyltransferase-like isoform X2 [Iris pallida]|uniref:Trans-resveratrol di-O-methyltransferase-like isoform X2 n=1 Tax=Iris pallida TaxID=29817 RepID=A0AAX6HTB6_IRIPA|nr:trans-resveratrol di-O-methyltransferase-like isoform X2 [Iris pallida]